MHAHLVPKVRVHGLIKNSFASAVRYDRIPCRDVTQHGWPLSGYARRGQTGSHRSDTSPRAPMPDGRSSNPVFSFDGEYSFVRANRLMLKLSILRIDKIIEKHSHLEFFVENLCVLSKN